MTFYNKDYITIVEEYAFQAVCWRKCFPSDGEAFSGLVKIFLVVSDLKHFLCSQVQNMAVLCFTLIHITCMIILINGQNRPDCAHPPLKSPYWKVSYSVTIVEYLYRDVLWKSRSRLLTCEMLNYIFKGDTRTFTGSFINSFAVQVSQSTMVNWEPKLTSWEPLANGISNISG